MRKDRAKESFQKQKSRKQTIQLGDGNSKFFFSFVQVRRIRNKITYLNKVSGEIIDEMEQISDACESYYKDIFAPP